MAGSVFATCYGFAYRKILDPYADLLTSNPDPHPCHQHCLYYKFFLLLCVYLDLQRAVFVKYPELRKLALATIASIEDRDQLERHFCRLDRPTWHSICEYLHLVPPAHSPEATEAGFSQVGKLSPYGSVVCFNSNFNLF